MNSLEKFLSKIFENMFWKIIPNVQDYILTKSNKNSRQKKNQREIYWKIDGKVLGKIIKTIKNRETL